MRYIGIAGAFALSLAIFTIAATRPHAFGDRSAKGITADIRQRFPAAAPLLARRPRPTGLPVAEALHVTLPRTYEGAQIVTGDGLSVEVVPLHVQAARRGDDDGLVVYADAWRDTDVICNPGIDGSEEFLYLRSAAAPTDFVHRISSAIPGRKLTAVRLAEGCIELSDANGGSLRIGKPFVIGHDGSVSERHIAWKVEPQEAGTWLVRLELNPEGLDYPLLIDPSWTTTRGMGMQRARHAATLLPNGKVLVTGGHSTVDLASCEIYDPVTARWSMTAPMADARQSHVAVLLPSGKVLVAGGHASSMYSKRCEVFDPAAGTWTQVGNMAQERGGATATLLGNGQVLVLGGYGVSTGSTDIAELFNPATGNWTNTGISVGLRNNHTATVLPNGKVLVIGGYLAGTYLTGCATYDPSTAAWADVAPLALGRSAHTATLLADGRVLVTGGSTLSAGYVSTCLIYDPASNTWSATGSMSVARTAHRAVLLPDGTVQVIGGMGSALDLSSTEIYNPTTGTWSTGTALVTGRLDHTATQLATGQNLVVGGYGSFFLSSSEVSDGIAGVWSATGNTVGPTPSPQRNTPLIPLSDGQVLSVVGSACERFDPASEAWSAAASPRLPHSGPMVMLQNGRVLAVGSTNLFDPTQCEIYDPGSNTWQDTGHTSLYRTYTRALLLPSGKVMAFGHGYSCELFDPVTGSWAETGHLNEVRNSPLAILMRNGKVLALGGGNPPTASCEVFDPLAGSWSYVSPLGQIRTNPALVNLPDGRVLVAGGMFNNTSLNGCEIFNPQTGEWTTSASMATPRSSPLISAMPDGRVLIAGGDVSLWTPTATCETFRTDTGVWSTIGTMAVARSRNAGAMLSDGRFLVCGNGSGGQSCEVFSVPASASRIPVISAATQSSDVLHVDGSGFAPDASTAGDSARASASGDGVAGSTSRSNIPCFQWQDAAGMQTWWLQPVGGHTSTAATLAVPVDAVGPGWLRVFVNGIPSTAKPCTLRLPAVVLTTSAGTISENGGQAVLTVTIERDYFLPISVTLVVGSGSTAQIGTDFSLSTTVLTIPSGARSAMATLGAIPDLLTEPGGETAVIDIAAVANGSESGTQSTTITITDYQSPGFSVSPISRHTTESGQTATFTVQPSSPPLANITLNLASTDSTEGVVSGGASLVFTTGNWTTAQIVTVTGVDDAIDDGDITYSILGSASSADPDYNNRAMPAVAVVNDDDDTAGITIAAPVGFITEGGGSATVGVSLASQPTSNVTLTIVSGTPAQGTASPSTLSFTTTNWNIPQAVTVTGADGDGADNPTAGTNFSLTATVTAGPGEYPTSITASRTLTCYPSNAAPAIAAIAPQSVFEDSTGNTVNLSGISAGGGNEAQTLTITATSSDPANLPDPVVTYTSPGASGSLNLASVANATGPVTVTVRVTDDANIGRAGAKDAARSTEITFAITVTALNDAPVISGTTATPWAQAEDDSASAGTLVGAILGGLSISDADAGALRGLAIAAAETANGAWQYNTGAGWNALGAVAEGSARLLADDGATTVRFVPVGNYNGPAVLTFRAWDRSSGTNGTLGDATTTGGTTVFSNTTATATVTVTPVNDAPVLAGTTGQPLTTVTGGAANPGTPVAALIQGLVSDVDNDPQGIAIVGVTGNGGAWSFSTDSGVTWGDLSTATAGNARLLSDAGSMLVRYAPQANEAGTASLVFRAWDRTSGSAGGTANITATGLTTAFSDLAATSTVTVTSGNAAPVVSLPTALLSYTENQAATPLDAAATVTDLDSNDFAGGTMIVAFILGASSDDRLEVVTGAGVTIAAGIVSVDATPVATAAGGSGVMPLTLAWNAAATPARVQRVLRAVCYRNLSDDPSTAVRIVRVSVDDGDGASSFPTTVTVTVAAVNDAPVLSIGGSAGTYVEDVAPLLLDAAATLADPDSPGFASGTFTATLQSGGEANDVLAIRSSGSIAVAGGEVSYNGTVFGTVSGGSGAATPLVVLLDADASQAAVQALMRNLTFASTSQHPSATTRTVRLRLADGAGGVSPNADVQVAVQPVNDAPTATVNPWQVNPGVPNSIPSFNLTLSDVDDPLPSTLVATITALPSAGSVEVDLVTATVGTQFTWQQAQDSKIRYLSPGAATTTSLVFTISDGVVSGLGPYTLPITVTDGISNLPPVLALGGTAQWQESLPPVPVDPNAEITDLDSPILTGGSLTALVSLNGTGDERLSIRESAGITVNAGAVAVDGVVVGTVTGGNGSTPLRVELNSDATLSRVTRVARAVSFAVDATAPGTAPRQVTVQVSDGTSNSEAKNADVQVIEVNSPAELGFTLGTFINEGSPAQILDASATCVDEDSNNFAGGQLTVGFDGSHEVGDLLGFTSTATITISGNEVTHAVGGKIGDVSSMAPDSLVVILNSNATPDRVRDLLRAVTMRNVSENPTAGTRVVQATLLDVDGGSGSDAIGVTVIPINDPPVVSLDASAVVWSQGEAPRRIDEAATVTDVDSADFAGGRLTVSLLSGASATDELLVSEQGPITVAAAVVSWNGQAIAAISGGSSGITPLVLALTAAATPARVQDLLRAIAFRSTTAVPSTQDRTVAVVLEDGDGGTSLQETRLVQVVQINLPPSITLSGDSAAYTEDTPAVALDDAASVSDPEGDVAGGVLTIIPEGADDRLSIANQGVAAGQIGVSGAQVTWGNTPLGTWSGGSGSALTIILAQTATPAGVRDLLRAVRYASVAQNPPASRSIGVTLNDGDGGTSVLVTRSVAITPVNDAPTASPTVLTVLGQDASGTWTGSDAEGDALTWTVDAQPANGTLSVDAALGTWSFTPLAAGSSTATVHLSDGSATTVLSVPVVVTAATDPRPVVTSDPPMSVQIGQTWTWDLQLADTDLPAEPSLEIEAIGAPAGLTITVDGGHRAVIAWPVPGTATAGSHAWFHLRISDRVSGRSALQPVLIHLRAPIAGGG